MMDYDQLVYMDYDQLVYVLLSGFEEEISIFYVGTKYIAEELSH